MLTKEQEKVIVNLVRSSLDQAEKVWDQVGIELSYTESITMDSMFKAEVAPSKIPGHSFVSDDNPQVSTYIALVADMRDSSDHLLHLISSRVSKVNQLQRVYYETSALLPALAQTIKFHNGVVTEYLGDGVLALFLVDIDSPDKDKDKILYAAHDAAKDCINDTRVIVNQELRDRYNLPDLDIGVGMAISKALVTLVGLSSEKQAKAIGECVWRASKLASGKNQIIVADCIKQAWPKSKGGSLKFSRTRSRGVDGYVIEKSN